MRLTKLEMAQLELAETKGKLARATIDAVQFQSMYNALLVMVANKELEKAKNDIQQGESSLVESKDQFDAVVAKIESRLGISLKDYSFDSGTGILSKDESREE
jgi:multidrug resistance efflux pump